METIRGKCTYTITTAALADMLAGYREVALDIGTGDGRYVQDMARTCPMRFAIGIDACRENLRQISQQAPPNALFAIANAEALPLDLAGLACHISINFPWGSLLTGLLAGDTRLLDGLLTCGQPGTLLDIRLNGDALAQAGLSLATGGAQVQQRLRAYGLRVAPPVLLDAQALRAIPTTWAKRLAVGRDPRALALRAWYRGKRET